MTYLWHIYDRWVCLWPSAIPFLLHSEALRGRRREVREVGHRSRLRECERSERHAGDVWNLEHGAGTMGKMEKMQRWMFIPKTVVFGFGKMTSWLRPVRDTGHRNLMGICWSDQRDVMWQNCVDRAIFMGGTLILWSLVAYFLTKTNIIFTNISIWLVSHCPFVIPFMLTLASQNGGDSEIDPEN